MKIRVNISIEYETYLKSKEVIKNLSRFVECGINKYYDNQQQLKERKVQNMSDEEREKLQELIMIASVPWTSEED